MHLVRNGLTCCPMLEHLHPQLLLHLPAIERLANKLGESRHDVGAVLADATAEELAAVRWLESLRVEGTDAYALPLFSEKYCDALMVEVDVLHEDIGAEPNEAEEEDYQIPEIVLESACLQLFAALNVFKLRAIDMVSCVVYGYAAIHTRSIQLARYSVDNTAKGNWHKDLDSDVTATVSLAPERFEGGGTDLRDGMSIITVPALPKGHALLFKGKATLHRGKPVTKGERDLLVFWLEVK